MTDLYIIKKIETQLGVSFGNTHIDLDSYYLTDENGNVIELVIEDVRINDLRLIGELKHLKKIQVTHCQINDISALSALKNLTYLGLVENQINDISILRNLKNLTYLYLDSYLGSNQIKDISALQNLTNLIHLGLQSNKIKDISALQNLTNLTYLQLNENQISDISTLQNLTNLTYLDLSNNQISDISTLQNLTNLTYLGLSNNQINDISVLQNLINLINVELSSNQIKNISALQNLTSLTSLNLIANQIIDISVLKNLTNLIHLYLSENQIIDISALKDLTNLTNLEISGNKIKNISALQNLKNLYFLNLSSNYIEDILPLQNLANLIWVYLGENKIKDISVLQNLTNLTDLGLSKNQIKDISALKNLTNLTTLYLDENQINDISPIQSLFKKERFDFDLENNPLKYPPIEIAELGKQAINEYFEHCKKGTSVLREAKVIVIGEAGAGKTTFAKKMQNPQCELPKPNETTLGIDVFDWDFDAEPKNVLNTKIWDFGGQDIYHGTHQFFFSDKSLYVLLADTREQKIDFNYWLNTVEQITGENSPLIIVLNRKQKHFYQIDEPGLKNRFGDIIRKVISVDLSNVGEIPDLQNTLKNEILSLPQIGYTLPTSWVEIRQELSRLEDKFISFSKFVEICKNNGITNPKVVSIISKLFTNIGVFTHFSDDFSSLHDIIFLDSDWLTKTVYLLLNHDIVKEKQGRITFEDISKIWESELYFEKNKFIELLKRFSLIYKINGSQNYIVPEYLPMRQPYDQWKYINEDGIYQFRYLFDNYMPKGIMPKLIVALHPYIYDNSLVWHRGVNVSNSISKPDTYAEILETYGRENRFDIRIYGKNQKDLLNLIIYHFDNILKPYKKLTHEKLVPCNCDTCKTSKEPHFYSYEKLKDKYDDGKKTIECDKKPYLTVRIEELLYGINFTELRSLLVNEKFEDFEKEINRRFSDLPYPIHKEKVSEGYFHSVFHTILAENGLNPVSEESTNDGRIDIHLTIGEVKYLFELKIDKTAEEALIQIKEKEYYRKFEMNFKKIILIGINFNSQKRTIQGIKTLKIN